MTTRTHSANKEEIQATIYDLLGQIAPEADLDRLSPDDNVREVLDIDSFDLLMLLVELDKAFGVAIPERDYGHLTTIHKTADYIAARMR